MLFGELLAYVRERREDLLNRVESLSAVEDPEQRAKAWAAAVMLTFKLLERELFHTERDVLSTLGSSCAAKPPSLEPFITGSEPEPRN